MEKIDEYLNDWPTFKSACSSTNQKTKQQIVVLDVFRENYRLY